eukprot:155900-Chlamydomonas_euryale.AAC.2
MIKWGQWSASRGDLFPPDFCDVLSGLHEDAPVHSWRRTRVALRTALGGPPEETFVSLEVSFRGSATAVEVECGDGGGRGGMGLSIRACCGRMLFVIWQQKVGSYFVQEGQCNSSSKGREARLQNVSTCASERDNTRGGSACTYVAVSTGTPTADCACSAIRQPAFPPTSEKGACLQPLPVSSKETSFYLWRQPKTVLLCDGCCCAGFFGCSSFPFFCLSTSFFAASAITSTNFASCIIY